MSFNYLDYHYEWAKFIVGAPLVVVSYNDCTSEELCLLLGFVDGYWREARKLGYSGKVKDVDESNVELGRRYKILGITSAAIGAAGFSMLYLYHRWSMNHRWRSDVYRCNLI
ncbi:MAG: hypothetical protein LBJ77_02160 [Holosporales bacterium]|nr:hypothetical protein [Holosporales bacterium]